MLNRNTTPRTVLGVYVTPQTLEAVLMRPAGNYAQILHRIIRPRARMGELARADDFSTVIPGMKSSDEIDFTLEVGDGGATGLDLDFDDADLPAAGGKGPRTFTAQLREILAECSQLGYGDPDLAFCIGAPDVAYVELTLAPSAVSEASSTWSGMVSRLSAITSGWTKEEQALHAALAEAYPAPYDAKRVIFVPMTPSDGGQRFLALVPTAEESVTPTVKTLTASDESFRAAPRLLDGEASLMAYYVEKYLQPETTATTTVVRVGTEDTLLLFLTGTELRHVERLRSLTSFDPAEMICSRVLLHQDEAKIDEVDHVLLVGGPRDERLLAGFESFYPDASVQRLHDALHDEVVAMAPEIDSALTPDTGPAMAAALRLIDVNKDANGSGNLFAPSILAKKRRANPGFAWHTVVMLLVLAAITLFFSWRYTQQRQEIQSRERVLALSPVEMPALTPAALRARVDSLNAVHARYNRALYVLDSLLVGSDEWSRAIERTATQTGGIGGVWFDNWNIDPSTIEIRGHAMDRSNLAALARELGGTVEELKFADLEGARVYPFQIRIDRQIEMPEVALKLREEALDPTATPSAERRDSSDARTEPDQGA